MTREAAPVQPRSSYVQSLARGLQLLELLSRSEEPMGLPELSRVLGVDPSTVYRLLGTLLQHGYVRQDPDSKRYCLSLKVVELSRRAIDRLGLRTVAKPYLKRLVEQTGESANLGVMIDNQVLCVDHEPSSLALAVTNEIGVSFALHATAMGKALLAALPDDELSSLLDRMGLPAYTPRTIADRATLQAHVQVIRRQGYALDDEERFIGVRCLAAPIYDHQGKVVAAISLSGPTVRMTLDTVPTWAELIKKTAAEISAAMGFTVFDER